MLSLATGHDTGYLTGAVGGGREGYYTGAVAAGEPPGVWYGAGAEALGLRGEVDADLMEALYRYLRDPRDPATHSRASWGEADALAAGHKNYRSADEVYAAALEREPQAGPERRAELRALADRSARQAVSFIDATFSAPKSVSVLGVAFERAANDARAAGDTRAAEAYDAHARAVEDAVRAGARASVEYLQDKAGYARVGHHGGGAGRWIDAHGWVVAGFLQHDSRERDPQLHVHQAILNRVLCADGTWRALDSRAIHAFRGAAGAIGERVMEAHLTRALGVRFETRPDGRSREVIGVRKELIELFSARRRDIGAKAEKLVAAFRDRFGREPSPLERTRLAQQATLATRKAKAHDGETLAQRLDRWEREARESVKAGLAEVADHVLRRAQHVEPAASWSEQDVIERAMAALKDRSSASQSDMLRAISDALPGHLDVAPEQVRELLDGLTDRALAHGLRLGPEEDTTDLPEAFVREDGRSTFEQPGAARWAMPGQVSQEQALRDAAVRRGAAAFTAEQADAALARFAESGVELGVDQAAALRGVLTSGAQVEVLAAAAGTGKSFTVGAMADTWTGSGRRVFGLATSQAATDVLAEERVTARNVASWLATQDRLDKAEPGAADSHGDEQWRLRDGDLVVVDEAGMADTGDLAAIQQRCEAAGAKLLLTGDPRQLAAVGAGGALADVAEHGVRYELAEVRRFSAAWERQASLRLREGDPAALDAYQRHGRLLDGGTAEQAEASAGRAWLADTLAGRESLLLVSSNEAAARTSAALRADLVALGRVEETGVELGRDGWQGIAVGVGDLVQARRNGWELTGWQGNTAAPINRITYRVTGLRADGGLTVSPVGGRDADGAELLGEALHLPASYVAADLTLGYASTVHAAQGRTVDTAHAVIGASTDAAGAYVAMTRGRDRNTAYAVTTAVPDDAPTGEAHDVEPRTARSVLADTIERDPREHGDESALAQRERAEQQARSTMTHVDRLIAGVGEVTAGRTGADLDRLAADGALSDEHRLDLAADPAYGALERLLRSAELAGHDPSRVLHDAVAARDLRDAQSPAQVLHARIRKSLDGQLTSRVTGFADLIPADGVSERDRRWLAARAEDADTRRRELAAETAEAAPQWAMEALGPVPDDVLERAEWEHRAGWAAAYREQAGHADVADPLGSAPPAGLAEKHALWRAAHAALDLPDAGAEEGALSDGQLRVRVRGYEREQTWAPRWVGDELEATSQRAEQARADALVWGARADAAAEGTEAEQLRADAAAAETEAAELAQRAADLEKADQARGAWYAAVAATREAADRARAELGARGVDLDDPAEQITAEEWLAAHRAEQAVEDEHRVIRDEAELIEPEHADVEPATLAVEHKGAAAAVTVEPVDTGATHREAEPVAASGDAIEPPAVAPQRAAEPPVVGDVPAPVTGQQAGPEQAAEPAPVTDAASATEPDARDIAPAPSAEPEPTPEQAEPPAATAEPEQRVAEPVAETAVPDVRDTTEPDATEHADPAQRHRVPTANETTAAVARAQAALAEIEARAAADAERQAADAAEAQRRQELTRWADRDRAAEQERNRDTGRVLQR